MDDVPGGFHANNWEKKLCLVLQSEAQYQTMIDNVQVELAYTCDGDVWFAFTERWADISKFDVFPYCTF